MVDKKRADGSDASPAQLALSWGAFIIAVILLVGLLVSAVIFGVYVTFWSNHKFDAELTGHMQAVIGLQVAGAVAFALVVFLRQTDGPITIDVFGFKFSGAASQIVMWIACFLAIAAAIKMCWSA